MTKFVSRMGIGLVALAAVGCGNEHTINEVDGEIQATPSLWDETVVVGEPTIAQFRLVLLDGQNVSIQAVTVRNIDGDYFSFDDSTLVDAVVGDGQDFLLDIQYLPLEEGYHRAEIEIVNNGKESTLVVDARAHAVVGKATVRPLLVDFGAVAAGESKTVEVTVENEGEVDLEIIGGSFSDTAFTFGESTPIALLSGDEEQVSVTFTAPDDAPITGTLQLDLGGYVTAQTVTLRANDCENGTPAAYDVDTDGYTSCGGDCDDDNSKVHPGATEKYDGVDEDCDGTTDEGTEGYDDDGDGQTELDGDCNDGDTGVSTTALEDYTNGVDDDCDGIVDYGTTDADADGYSEAGGDCDDLDGATYPGAPELADGIDNDCDGISDEGTVDYDDDGDGYDETAGDCDDTDASTYPSAAEAADWRDNDCDGTVDEGTTNYDDDGDGFSELGGDCDDADDTVNPGEPETTGNGVDDDCDGTTL